MKLLTLELLAYGPFTNIRLDFTSAAPGLNIVYGHNEAGKSSALRALIALLYGFETQTRDNFQHANKDLLIGGTLADTDGAQISIRRRKGNKNTLLNTAGQPINEQIMQQLLGGIDKNFFQALFGIDHRSLRHGGEEIRQGGGQVGAALFAAGTGLTGLRGIAEQLHKEADALFKYKGQKPRINELNQQCVSLRREQEQKAVRGSDWQTNDEELRLANAELAALKKKIQTKRSEQARLERLNQALPHVAKYKELDIAIKELADAVLLPVDFATRRLKANNLFDSTKRDIANAEQELARINAEIQGLKIDRELLALASTIQHWYQKAGAYLKNCADLPNLQTRLNAHEHTAQGLIKDIRPGLSLVQAEEQLRLTKASIEGIRELGNQYGALSTRLSKTRTDLTNIEAKYTKQHQLLANLGQATDTTELARTCELVKRAGDIETRLAAIRDKLLQEQAQAETDLRRLGNWDGDLATLELLALPTTETVEIFNDIFADLMRQRESLNGELNKARTGLADMQRQLEVLRLEQAVPDENTLLQARQHRDAGWQLVRSAWLKGQRDHDAERLFNAKYSLPDAYEYSVTATDDIADRLRRETARVQQQANIQANITNYHTEIKRLQQLLENITQAQTDQERDWRTLWEPLNISARPPKEMRSWLKRAEALRTQISNLQRNRQELISLTVRRNELLTELGIRLEVVNNPTPTLPLTGEGVKNLSSPLSGQIETLESRLNRAQAIVQQQETLRQQRLLAETAMLNLAQQRDDLARWVASAGQELNTWQDKWTKAVAVLGLDAAASPTQANAALGCIEDLFNALKSATELRHRINGIQRDNLEFEHNIANFCTQVAADLQSQAPSMAINSLYQRLQEAQTNTTRLEELQRQTTSQQQQLKKANANYQRAEQDLDSCVREAQCASYDMLPLVETRSTQRRELEQKFNDCLNHLVALSAGKGEVALISEVAQVDADTIPGLIATIIGDIKELEQEQANLNQKIGEKTEILRQWGGGSEAADQAMALEQTYAAIRTAGERYLRLRLASAVLEQQIETYRRTNQTPLLNLASDIFARLTVGAFSGLATTYTDNDTQVLQGIRTTNEHVPVEGMSDGTCDQLYLALFLASIQNYLDRVKPKTMPLIVDDILINYDDRRSAATLQVLAELSKHTQIILFTHHAHLVELARTTLGAELLCMQNL